MNSLCSTGGLKINSGPCSAGCAEPSGTLTARFKDPSRQAHALQGVLSPQDARAAVDAGVDGIVLSNHGGRQLDHSPAPLDMVAAVRAAIGYRVPLLMDGGIRRGTDVLKVSTQQGTTVELSVCLSCHV